MNIKNYLERIKYTGPVDPTFEVLSKLQATHLLNVSFENLDIHNHTKINLSNLYDKIVTRRRGGFCYELNGLFYELIKEIGFTVKMISAKVYEGNNAYSPEYDHMALIVQIKDDNYLVDVGFGEFLLHPMKIERNKETEDPRGIFRIKDFDEGYLSVQKRNADGAFVPEYIFLENERQFAEFHDRCNYHQTSGESHFVQKRICSLPTNDGRITLTGSTLKVTANGVVTERKLIDEQEVQQVLWNYFGIKL